MKKCISCGREIPDDAVFCGFCGTRQPENENTEEKNLTPVNDEEQVTSDSEEVTEDTENQKKEETAGPEKTTEEVDPEVVETASSEEPSSEENETEIQDAETVEPSDKEEQKQDPESDSQETEEASDPESETEESDTESVDTTDSEEQPAEENDSEIKEAEITDSSEPEKTSEGSESKDKTEENKSDQKEEPSSEKPEKKKPHIQMKKIDLPKINVSKEDFNVLLDIVQNPVERHGIDNTTTWIILIFAWIANWIAFGSFASGFFSLLIVLIGMIFIDWLSLKDHATFGETVRNSAEVIFTPSLLVFAGGLFIRNVTAGAEVFAFHSIFTTAFIGLFFLTSALILFLLTVIKRYEMKIWQIVLILTIFVSLLIWYLMTSGAIALFS